MSAETLVPLSACTAHKSRWGWHPCSREVFGMLKELHKRFEKARNNYHAWLRWSRKLPKNRVIRKYSYDAEGKRITHLGRTVVGPMPEPKLDPVFVHEKHVQHHLSWNRQHYVTVTSDVELRLVDHNIVADYANARMPAATYADVRPMKLSETEIRTLYLGLC